MSIGAMIAAATIAALGEVGGYVVDDESGRPLGDDVSVILHSDVATVSGAKVKTNGIFNVQAPPGTYWAQVLKDDQEVHTQRVQVPAGSKIVGLRVKAGGTAPALGVGGSGPADAAPGVVPFVSPMPFPDTWIDQLIKRVGEPSPLVDAPRP